MTGATTHAIEQIASSAAHRAARNFAAALAETPEFIAFEVASQQLDQDAAAQSAIAAYQERQRALQAEIMLGRLSAEQRAGLLELYRAMTAQPAVGAYLQAQAHLQAVCQKAAEMISAEIGLNFAACKGGCC